MAGDKWIQSAHLKEGAFTAKAHAAHKGVQEFAHQKENAPGVLGKEARLAERFKAMANAKRAGQAKAIKEA